ncbi:hypothetical protein [Tellurirhabdus bombi]|uniref:hypothetical protein n=1 Tax=Tellurirhabdus bombi TaxID=2907205 RepID=UPI001F2B9121|nr:hypothetical protein [Tellurirhabdus bombi]
MAFLKRFSGQLRKSILPLAILIGFACGPGPSDINEFMSYFLPESSDVRPQDRIYAYTPQLYDYEAEMYQAGKDSVVIDDNVRAWMDYSRGKLSAKAVYEGMYGSSPNTEWANYLETNNLPASTYMQLAYAANAASAGGDMWNPKPADTTRLTLLLEQAQEGFKTASDGFLKERYAFQAVKLADQIGQSEQSRTLYDQLVKPLTNKTFISDWALCRHAGATLALGDTAQAIYEFAQVFDRCPSRRKEAEASLRIHGIRFREEALRFAKNDHEKAAVYALCAIQPKQDALPYIKEVVKLDPKNPLIGLMLAREINRNEFYFFQKHNPIYAYDEKSRADSVAFGERQQNATSYFEQLKSFAFEAAENKDLGQPAYYLTAAAYLEYLGKDYDAAKKTLEKASQQPATNPALGQQIALQQMLLLAAETEAITPEVENQLIGYLERFGKSVNFRLNNAFVKACQQFAERYRATLTEKSSGWLSSCSRSKDNANLDANTAKAFLLQMLTTSQLTNEKAYFINSTDQLDQEDTTSSATAQKLVAFATQQSPTAFDTRLLKLTGFNNDYFYALLGRRLMAEHQYAQAGEAFAKVSPSVWQEEAFREYFTRNPFTVKMPGENRTNTHTPVTFAQRMAELQTQAKNASGNQAAELYYQLGCGAYNLSWHGNAWLLVRRYRSSIEPSAYKYAPYRQTINEQGLEQMANDTYYTTAPARAFFEQAAKAAQDPNLAAKAMYMAARCEENAFLTRKAVEEAKRGYEGDPNPFKESMRNLRKTEYATVFEQYKKQYAESTFNREMIRECALYSAFLAGKTAERD